MVNGRRLAWLCILIAFTACNNNSKQPDIPQGKSDSLAIREQYKESPVLDAESAILKMQIEKGLKVELVASEPLVIAPVALTFDNKGRMWVVEMTGYMPDTLGTGESAMDGKIVILEDTDGDGRMDQRKVFMDSLVLPRSICLIENGILIAEPPKLWFVEINNDKPGKKTLVDGKYAEGGNVEHQPNGLLRAMDNWIYNAKSSKRYRKKGNKWLIEETHFRGQWGITQDDQGRLFYNNNSENILGDYFSPGLGSGNTHQQRVAGFNEKIIRDNRVFPIRATTGVNRGYMKGTLNDSLRLVNFTAACGPLIYRTGLLGEKYKGNGFVAEPSGNLVKRNIITDSGLAVKGRQAYENREFLASTDERFRPVNLYTGLDGAMYVLDMYRGIIQHKTYLTPYLKNEIRERALSLPLNCGRIYRVVPEKGTVKKFSMPADPASLVQLLTHENGSVRDLAQQTLVDSKNQEVVPQLKKLIAANTNATAIVHAMWTLEGLHALKFEDLEGLIQHQDQIIRTQALAALPSVLENRNEPKLGALLNKLLTDSADATRVAMVLGNIKGSNAGTAQQLQSELLKLYPRNVYIADAIISTMENREDQLHKKLLASNDTSLAIFKRIEKVRADMINRQYARKNEALAKQYPLGVKLFNNICQTCHGKDGGGIASLAPPLNQSNWVTGSKDNLSRIVLFGLTGPIDVNGKLYKAPEINGDMPGIASNDEFSDQDIAQLMNFIRNAWSNKGSNVSVEDVRRVRAQHKDRQKPFTMEELKTLK